MLEFNTDPRIRLIDKQGELIALVSQRQACHLLRNGYCCLLMVKPPTIQFQLDRWNKNYLFSRNRNNHWSNPEKYLHGRKSVLYGNYRVQSPEGHEMFHCNCQRVLWYLNRDIVDIVCDDPPTIRLKFIPNGPGHTKDPYYLAPKINRCVVCGSEAVLSRHHVIPRVFRCHMPEEIKDHSYHDILLLCINCHQKYEKEADKYKIEFCKKFGIEAHPVCDYDQVQGSAIKSAHALTKYKNIPLIRQEELKDKIREFLGKKELTEEDIQAISDLDYRSCCFIPKEKHYGKAIVHKIDDIYGFIVSWRKHFIEIMQPKFLPDYWNINKPLEKNIV